MTDLAKKRTAFHELSRIYDYLDKIIDILVDDRPVNLGNQLPIAEQFIRKVTDSTGEIITIYCGIMGRKDGATSKEVLEIEKKINDIFSEVKNVLTECQKIDCKGNFEFSSQNLPVETAEVIFNENKIDVFNQSRVQMRSA